MRTGCTSSRIGYLKTDFELGGPTFLLFLLLGNGPQPDLCFFVLSSPANELLS